MNYRVSCVFGAISFHFILVQKQFIISISTKLEFSPCATKKMEKSRVFIIVLTLAVAAAFILSILVAIEVYGVTKNPGRTWTLDIWVMLF